MPQNSQTHFKNPAAFAARFLKCLTILGDYALKGYIIQFCVSAFASPHMITIVDYVRNIYL